MGQERTSVLSGLPAPEPEVIDVEWRVVPEGPGAVRQFLANLGRTLEQFLAFIAVLSFYLAFSGRRVLKLKDLARGGSAKFVDWFVAIAALVACACLAGQQVQAGAENGNGMIDNGVVFGAQFDEHVGVYSPAGFAPGYRSI